ncbi:hypothetical protein [Paraprevotella xylaniphila]|uniref:hypothetical protein n=1 Tax=Paraprevotella xylaniphila TaxID=454155 RepID=UPI0010327F08|nr:hypothetical protein [Paraprevotella xylaniphila]
MKWHRIYLLLLICLSNIGCTHKQNIGDKMLQIKSKQIKMPLNSMFCIKSSIEQIAMQKKQLKLIVYLDSVNCSTCTLRNMYVWHDLMNKAKTYKESLYFYFILHPLQSENKESLYLTAKGLHFPVPIYIDTLNCFSKENPHIPNDPLMHTFLLDDQNNVILVGDPTKNPRIEEMFWRIVKEKLGEPKDSVGR